MSASPSRRELQDKITELTARLREAEEALSAIREGEVDAIVVSGRRGERVFSLAGTDLVYRLIVESMQEAALTTSLEGRILFCNRQFSSMLKRPLGALFGRKLADLVSVEDHPLLVSLLRNAQSNPVRGRVTFHGATGIVPSQISASFLSQPEGPSICIVAADLSDLEASAAHLRQSNAELERSGARLRRLAGELAQTEERERGRLASILHDGLQQLLVGAQLHMHRVISDTGKEPGPYSRKVVDLLDRSIEMSRSLALEISPPVRVDSGLAAAFKWLARSMEARFSLKVTVKSKGAVDPAGEEISMFLFRSVQELLLNVVKHSGVMTADIRVEAGRSLLKVSVTDRGRGLDKVIMKRGSGDEGFGLFSIRERVSLVGGQLEIRSLQPRGSSFTLVVPLESLRPNGQKAAPAERGPARPPRVPAAGGRHSGKAGARAGGAS